MSQKTAKQNGTVNVEGILASFFLKKMQDSEEDSRESRRRKHKKHKSKKSKKHKRSRSHSYEMKSKDHGKYLDNYSSSEEKDIQRLQKLKKLDPNNKLIASSATVSESSSDNNISTANETSSIVSDIPYGPSLETLLGITLVNEMEAAQNSNSIISEKTGDVSVKTNDRLTPESDGSDRNVNASISSEPSEGTKKDEEKPSNGKDKESCHEDVNSVKETSQKKSDKKSTSRSRSASGDEEKQSKSRSSRHHKKHSRSRSRQRTSTNKRSRSRSHSPSRSRSSSYSRSRKRESSRSMDKDKRHSRYSGRKRSRSTSRRRKKSRSRSRSSGRVRSHSRYSRHRSRSHDRYDDSRYSSKHRRRRSSSSDYKSKKSRKRSRSGSKGRSSSHKIDQEKIRQIAQKNVLNMIEKGTLPEGLSIDNFKKEQLASIKAGGKSVQELTDFCTKLSKRENDPVEEAKSESDKVEESAFIHHPFKIKEASTIKLNIKNAVQIPIKTHAEKVAETARLSSQFPVSSGDQHRKKELEWIPVEPSTKAAKSATESKALVPLQQSAALPAAPQVEVKEAQPACPPEPPPDPLPPPPPPPPEIPALLPPPLPPVFPQLSHNNPPMPPKVTAAPAAIDYPVSYTTAYPVPQTYSYAPEMNTFVMSAPTTNFLQPSTSVFPRSSIYKSRKPVDVAIVVSQRLNAINKLKTNPDDKEAIEALNEAQARIQDWVESKQVPGLFTGSTGVKTLSIEELSGPRHWQYKVGGRRLLLLAVDVFTKAAPVREGKGMNLMMKMGWNPGKGLGKNNDGSLEPLILDFKTDKKGFCSEGEGSKKLVSSVVKDIQGKHPVSALMELCSKRKWKPPLYTLIKDSGPSHKKLFLYKVEVNNIEYQAANPVNNKKMAKADSAVICLQALNIFPKTT